MLLNNLVQFDKITSYVHVSCDGPRIAAWVTKLALQIWNCILFFFRSI